VFFVPKPNQTLTTGHHDDFGTDFGRMSLISFKAKRRKKGVAASSVTDYVE